MSTAASQSVCLMWDFDGTLVDTIPLWRSALLAVLQRHGGQLSPTEIEAVLGSSAGLAATEMARVVSDGSEPHQLRTELVEHVVEHLRRRVPWRPGVLELLRAARRRGMRLALVSSSPAILLAEALGSLPAGTFECVVSGDDVARPKPAPDCYQRACRQLGIEPALALAVGNSRSGVAAAGAAGVKSLVVGTAAGPDGWGAARVDDLSEVSIELLSRLLDIDPDGPAVPIHPAVRRYSWGSPTAIPDLLGTAGDDRPVAELWIGAHPLAPATLTSGESLLSYLQRRPSELGAKYQRLPFLMKLLAAARPLSLQVHPNRGQARDGYLREVAAGIPIDAPERNYRDREPKPELILALTPFAALRGFRPPQTTREELGALLGPDGRSPAAVELLRRLDHPSPATALRAGLEHVLSGSPAIRKLARVSAARAADTDTPQAATLREVGAAYDDDPGILAAALLNRVELDPGEALFLDAGHLHAYLHGVGVEVMTPSDNVLRGGLTEKYVDVPELLAITRFAPLAPATLAPITSIDDGVTITSHKPPVDDFAVHTVHIDAGRRELPASACPATLLVTAGTLTVERGARSTTLARGESAFLGSGEQVTLASTASATAYLATAGTAVGPLQASVSRQPHDEAL